MYACTYVCMYVHARQLYADCNAVEHHLALLLHGGPDFLHPYSPVRFICARDLLEAGREGRTHG